MERHHPDHLSPARGEHRIQIWKHARLLRTLGRTSRLRRHARRRQLHAGACGHASRAHHAGESEARHSANADRRPALGQPVRARLPIRHAARHALAHARRRLVPFTDHCAMPVLPGTGPLAGHVLSHDQVEAALMRRAGYDVRVLPEEGLSFEENPPTLLEFKRRDLRWLHGNMQYCQLLSLPGLKPVSRFQLLFAILMYLSSPAWMAMMAIGTITLALSETQIGPAAPVRLGAGALLFGLAMFMTWAPKIASVVDLLLRERARRSYGGGASFVSNVATEALHMILLSPIMALAHTLFIIRLFVFRRGGSWNSQLRESHAVPWRLALTRLWPQTLAGCLVLGVVLTKAPEKIALAFMGAGGLLLAVPFAVATASPLLGIVLARMG